MKKNLLNLWFFLLAVFFTVNLSAQVTIGNMKSTPKVAEAFSALEVISNGKGGLRLPQLTSDQRNTLALSAISNPGKKLLANGLSIYNTTTNCVEYWNNNRWISLCEGTSQTTIDPQPCTNVLADGTGCEQTFTVTDPDCPNGPFSISIVAGAEYAFLENVDNINGTFQIKFKQNETVNSRSVLVRVTSSCNNQYKDFIFEQNGVVCTPFGTPPVISPANSNLNLCIGGAVYLSVPVDYANLDKLIWTRNGVEVARGINYYVATIKGTYNVSLGAAGCNVIASNDRVITESGIAPATINTIIASKNGIICGSGGSITLSAIGATGSVSWFKDGILSSKTGTIITLTGVADTGNWFAAGGTSGCYSKPSNTINVVLSTPGGTPININTADVLVNNTPINSISTFCSGGSLVLKVNNSQAGVSYTWYNGETIITSPYIVPSGQTKMLLRMVATDNSGNACPVEASSTEISIASAVAPGTPTITGSGVICDGTADLTIVPAAIGIYTYQWYKNGALLSTTTQTISVTESDAVYAATVTNATGCVSPLATKTIASEVSSIPVLSWVTTDSATIIFGSKVTYEVAVEHGPATYVWSVDGGATFTGTGKSITVTFPLSGSSVNIKVKASNACGTSVELTKTVQLTSGCPTPSVAASSSTSFSTITGIGIQATVFVTNGNQQTYQWYSNSTASTTGGTVINGANAATINYTPNTAGTVYLYCIVKNGCSGNPVAPSTPLFTVNVSVDPGTLALGSGTFTGKTCFDINKSNYGGSCGTQSGRNASMTDFKTQNVQPYVFTASASGTKKNLRFIVVDALGAVQSTNADAVAISGTVNNNQVVTLTVTYKNTLSDAGSIAYGKTTDQAVNVKIYAVYNDGTRDLAVLLNVKIQDCACCGAYVAAGVWKSFMCHNLGANTSLDPNVPSLGIAGNYYVYGDKNPVIVNGSRVRSSPMPNIGASGWVGTAIKPKADKDPCPDGYRVPTNAEWDGVAKNNAKKVVTSSNPSLNKGLALGDNLFLPLASCYQYNLSNTRDPYTEGMYSTSNAVGGERYAVVSYFRLTSSGGAYMASANSDALTIFPVRCIEQ